MDPRLHRPHASTVLPIAACTAVALAAVAGGAIWMLRSGEAERIGGPESRANGWARAPSDAASGVDEGATRSPLEENAASASSGLPPCEPGPPEGLLVRAVGDDGRPIAGAQIYVVPERDALDRSLFEQVLPFLEEPRRLVAARAHGYLADVHGEVHVVRPPFDAFLLGFADDRRGASRLLEPDGAAFELRLERACDLVVEVVDATDAPVRDARVATASRAVPDATLDPGNDHRPPLNLHHAGTTTDERGLVRLIGIDVARRRHAQISRMGKFALCVAVPYLGARTQRGVRDLEEPASLRRPVRVRLEEPFGVIEVRVVDRGRALALDGEVTVDSSVGSGSRFDPCDADRAQRRPLERGVARFAPVALGARFDVSVRIGGGTAKRTIDGPRAAGEVVRVDLDPQRDRRLLRGRLVGVAVPPNGTLRLAGEIQRIAPPRLKSADGREVRVAESLQHLLVPVAADVGADGSFEIDVTSVQPPSFTSLQLRGFDRERLEGFVANASIPEQLVEPVTDLGEIPVVALPLLAVGRVVDDLGRPIGQVAVSLTNLEWQFGPIPSDWGPRATSDADGRFALVGEATESGQRLHFAPPPGFATAALALPADGRELECVLPRTGRIVGTLSTDFAVSVIAVARAPAPGAAALTPPMFGADGFPARRDERGAVVKYPLSFELRPGRYDLFVTTTPDRPRTGVVACIADLEVRPAEVTADPRLSPLEITRGNLGWRIHLSRSDGAPPPSAWVRIAPVDAPDAIWRTEFVSAGEATLESSLETAWIDVCAVSFKRVHEVHGRGDVSIVLEPLTQRDVEIALDTGDAPHTYDLHWIVAADSSRPLPGFMREIYATTVMPGGTASLSLDEGERWKIRLFAQIDAGGAPRRVELGRCAKEVSTLCEAGETPAQLSIVVHADEVDALWQELSRSE